LPLCAGLIALVIALSGCGEDENKPPPPGTKLENLLKAGKLAEAERFCRELVKKEGSNQVHRGNLAKVLCMRGEVALKEAGFFDPDPKKAKKAKEHPSYAQAQGFFAGAASEARLVFKKVPEKKWWRFAKVRATLGLALYRRGRVKQAVKELERAVADDNRLAAAHNTLGMIYHETGERKTALAHFKAALLAEPGLAEAAYNLGVYYEDEAAALADAEAEAKRLKLPPPKDSAARKARAHAEAVRYYKRYLEGRAGAAAKNQEVRDKIKKLKGGASAAPRDAPRPA